jgi:hypothetical protein
MFIFQMLFVLYVVFFQPCCRVLESIIIIEPFFVQGVGVVGVGVGVRLRVGVGVGLNI